MGKKVGRPPENRQEMAQALVEAGMSGDAATAKKYGVTTQTLRNYRKLLKDDPSFFALFEKTASPVLTRPWADDLDDALRKTIAKMLEMVQAQGNTDPDALQAVTKAFSAMAEMQLTKEYLNDDDPDDEQARAFEEAQAGVSSSSLN